MNKMSGKVFTIENPESINSKLGWLYFFIALGIVIIIVTTSYGFVIMGENQQLINYESPYCFNITCPGVLENKNIRNKVLIDPDGEEYQKSFACHGYAYREDPNDPNYIYCNYSSAEKVRCVKNGNSWVC